MTPEELVPIFQQAWATYRDLDRWPVLFAKCRDVIIEVQSATPCGVLVAAAAAWSVAMAKEEEIADAFIAAGWEMHLRMHARGLVAEFEGAERRVAAQPESKDGSVLVSEIGGTWAIGSDGKIITL